MGKPLKISEEAAVQMPMKTVASLIAMVAIGTWAYFGINESLNKHNTQLELMERDLEMNTEFRIKWPRGEMGSLPADAEQFMLIEHIAGQLENMQTRMEDMMNNGVNIKRLQEDVKALRDDVEKLKDGQRRLKHSNGG